MALTPEQIKDLLQAQQRLPSRVTHDVKLIYTILSSLAELDEPLTIGQWSEIGINLGFILTRTTQSNSRTERNNDVPATLEFESASWKITIRRKPLSDSFITHKP